MTRAEKIIALKIALFEEQTDIVARLNAIDAGLGQDYSVAAATYLASPMTEFDKCFALNVALIHEQTDLLARLAEIDSVFGLDYSVAAAPSSATRTTPEMRTVSASSKARMAASEKMKRSAKKSVTTGKAGVDGTPKQLQGTVCPATQAVFRDALQARWTRLKSVASSGSPKQRRKLNAARLAIIIAEAKARWARVMALTVKAANQ